MRFPQASFSLRHSSLLSLLFLFTLLSPLSFAADDKEPDPCTIPKTSSRSYYDLRPMALYPLADEDHPSKQRNNESWHARGYDYGANFTINLCAPVVEELDSVVGVDRSKKANVSAFYDKGGKVYSIGQVSTAPLFRGRKLVMNLTNGSPCDEDETGGEWSSKRTERWSDDDDESDSGGEDGERKGDKGDAEGGKSRRRKSTILSFLCDQEYDPAKPKVSISFVGWSEDECSYSFEVRSHMACGGQAKAPDAVGPGGVFSLIAIIAIGVYIFGGIAYQRTVMHQRGWRQLPNYAMWAGIGSFISDFATIIFSSCSRFFPRRRGYNQLPIHHRSRGISREEENGLIDALDEEWND